jgi:hypothetical protein
MAQRGLVITVILATVFAAVFIGVMAIAANDSDESVQNELSTLSSRRVRADASPSPREPGTYEIGYRVEVVFIDPGFP